ALTLRLVARIEVEDHPVLRAVEVVRTRGVRVQRGEVPVAAPGMENRQPRGPGRVEATRRNGGQLARDGLCPILAVDVEEHRDGRFRAGRIAARAAWTLQEFAERGADRVGAPRADAGYAVEPPVVACRLQPFERLDAQRLVNARGERGSDARKRAEEPRGVDLALQALELRPATGRQHLGDRPGNARADAWQRVEPDAPLVAEDLADASRMSLDGVRCAPVGTDAERVGALCLQQLGSLAKPRGDAQIVVVRRSRLLSHARALRVSERWMVTWRI